MRQTKEAMVRAMGVKIQAKRPAFPMMTVVVWNQEVVVDGCSEYGGFGGRKRVNEDVNAVQRE